MTEQGESQQPTDPMQDVSALEGCKKQRDEYLAGWQRARADFANYKKEEMQRVAQLVRFSQEGMLSELLLVLDSFDLARVSMPQDTPEYKSFSLIQSQLFGILKRHGLDEIVPQEGDAFDPAVHEAIETVDHEHVESGSIAALVYKGYRYEGKVLRPARVRIAK